VIVSKAQNQDPKDQSNVQRRENYGNESKGNLRESKIGEAKGKGQR